MNQITMLMYCTDQKGIIAAVTNFIHQNQGNITYIDQYVDRPNAVFFMRVECDLNALDFDFQNFKDQLVLPHLHSVSKNKKQLLKPQFALITKK